MPHKEGPIHQWINIISIVCVFITWFNSKMKIISILPLWFSNYITIVYHINWWKYFIDLYPHFSTHFCYCWVSKILPNPPIQFFNHYLYQSPSLLDPLLTKFVIFLVSIYFFWPFEKFSKPLPSCNIEKGVWSAVDNS